MNKKVFKTMIALVVIFLVACYVLKIFFPEQFVMTVNNQVIISVGEYLNTHAWAFYIFGIANSFLSYWLYLCAVCKRLYLNWWQCLVVLGTIGVNIGLTHLDTNLYSAFSIISFVVLPLIFKSDLKTVAIGYSIHLLAKQLLLELEICLCT